MMSEPRVITLTGVNDETVADWLQKQIQKSPEQPPGSLTWWKEHPKEGNRSVTLTSVRSERRSTSTKLYVTADVLQGKKVETADTIQDFIWFTVAQVDENQVEVRAERKENLGDPDLGEIAEAMLDKFLEALKQEFGT